MGVGCGGKMMIKTRFLQKNRPHSSRALNYLFFMDTPEKSMHACCTRTLLRVCCIRHLSFIGDFVHFTIARYLLDNTRALAMYSYGAINKSK